MKIYNPQDIRNIAVVGHGGEGKTTLTEAMLFNCGAIERMGRVEDGNTTTDFDPEEVKRQISISAALAPVEWNNCKINLVDAPGYFDFVSETIQAYYLADSALILVSAQDDISVGAENAYKYCKKNKKPMAFLVNEMDKEHASFEKTLEKLKEKFGTAVTPIHIPMMDGAKMTGVVDIVENKAYENSGKTIKETAVPDAMNGAIEANREALIENAAANDEALMEKFFEGEELSKDDILKGLKAGINDAGVIPVFAVSAALNIGVVALMNALTSYMPNPLEAPAAKALDEKGEEVAVPVDPAKPFAAQVIKTIADPFVGKISIVKVYQGALTPDAAVVNARTGKGEKCSNLSVMIGKKSENISKINAGDIGAIAKLQQTVTGDTLCAANAKITFAPIAFSEPCISLAVTAKKQGEEEKVFAGLHRLEEEDPSFTLTSNAETGETLANGMGEMHLEVIMQKLKNKFNVEAVLVDPKVPYRETIRKSAEAEGKHKKQSGGAGQFGVVSIRFEPITDGSADFEFVNKIVGGVVPKEFIPAVEKGLRESIVHGVLAGYPMVGIRATLFDGKYHPVDSKEVAFKSAARLAYKAACANANPVLLEPICKAEVLIPDEYMGDIIGDLNRRRGRILGMNPQEDGQQQVVAEVPMSEMVKYATDLRSMTQARGTFKLTFERYEELPAQMAQKVIEQAKLDAEE